MLTNKATATNSRAFIAITSARRERKACASLSGWAAPLELQIVTLWPSALYDGPTIETCCAVMFVIEQMYKAPLAKVDAHMRAHLRFLKKYYASGHFLVSGRKIPRDGGIILAVGWNRKEIEAIVAEDPFCARGLGDFRVIEFRASQKADDIQQRIATYF